MSLGHLWHHWAPYGRIAIVADDHGAVFSLISAPDGNGPGQPAPMRARARRAQEVVTGTLGSSNISRSAVRAAVARAQRPLVARAATSTSTPQPATISQPVWLAGTKPVCS